MKTARKLSTVQNQAAIAVQAPVAAKSAASVNLPKSNLKLVGGTDFEKQFVELPLEKVEAGNNWRKIFNSPDFPAFVENIRENGVLEPILVAPLAANGLYPIIAGERRYRASLDAGKTTIPARVLNLSEDKLLDAHIAENLQRKDLEAMEEAEGLLELISSAEKRNLNLTIGEIARRVGKPAEHVALRLQLNKLIPEAKQDLRDGFLEPKVAERIASFPENQQQEIYNFAFETEWVKNKQTAVKNKPVSLRALNDRIASNIVLDLAFAPFSTASKELRADGLACGDCKERTGAETLLFKDLNDAKKDLCMAKSCYLGKTKKHIELVQISVAREIVAKRMPKVKKGETSPEITDKQIKAELPKVPFISTSYWENPSETVLGTNRYAEIKKTKDACEFAVKGVFVKGDRVGKTALICLSTSGCQKHHYSYKSGSTANVKSGDDFKKNRQQLFDLRADQFTRRKVISQSVELFDENKTVWSDVKLRGLMLASMLQTVGYNDRHRRKLICEVLNLEEKTLEYDSYGATDVKIFEIYEKVSLLSEAVQSKLFFLLTVGSFGENENESRSIKQTHVEFLAEHLGINYNLLEAEARVDLCAARYKKQLPDAKAHLEKAQNSTEPINPPSFFFDFRAENKTVQAAETKPSPVETIIESAA